MKKRITSLLVALILLAGIGGCKAQGSTKHSASIYGAFDTVITLLAYTETDETFEEYAALVKSEFLRLHAIFDQYNAYEGVNNLYALNVSAGKQPTAAQPQLIDLLLLSGRWREQYSRKNNPAMGAVLNLWHNARTAGTYVPAAEALSDAAQHCNFDDIVIDQQAGTVFYADDRIRMDLGAVAKGYAAQLVYDKLIAAGCDSFVLNAGGNVVCGGAPLDGRPCWTVGLQATDGVNLQGTLAVKYCSIVTSGDYQRYYEVDGKRYHHLIDPDTLQPGAYMHSVTVLCEDSALGDFLSTALFLTAYEEGRALVEATDGLEACWNLLDGTRYMTDGFAAVTTLLN